MYSISSICIALPSSGDESDAVTISDLESAISCVYLYMQSPFTHPHFPSLASPRSSRPSPFPIHCTGKTSVSPDFPVRFGRQSKQKYPRQPSRRPAEHVRGSRLQGRKKKEYVLGRERFLRTSCGRRDPTCRAAPPPRAPVPQKSQILRPSTLR